ncbi:hypothetical protein B0J11DRAFT_503083 [Dendryphion nanum]|uniref:Integral membrane protein n=1 Tax=Dendryphion nanum TaxID=256645 RepID=A0A9P9E771_9PLEO|nr:hypothetical protein B0J11DRAFT_503083 [Dendryphion nanum]
MNRLFFLALAATTSLSAVVAESVINFGQLPACAKASCAVLTQADANCVPPAAPVTNQGIYQSCVCESALLTGLKASGTLCQTAGCSAEDATKISQYFIALCAGPVVQQQTVTVAPTTPTTATTATTSAPKNTATAGAAGGNTLLMNRPEPSWISTHWKYVVMVVVIAVAMAVFWIGGIYVRRHFDRKREAKRANLPGGNNTNPGASGVLGASGGAPAMASLTSTVVLPAHHESQSRTGTPAPAGMPQRTRSRANTLRSLRGENDSSRTSLSQPVVWGPHQHQAAYNNNGNNSTNNINRSNTPGPSVPPSPVYRNPDAMRSEPHRFAHPRAMSPAAMNGEPTRYANTSHGPPTNAGWGSSPSVNEVERPHTRDVVNRRTLSTTPNGSNLSVHPEGQSAEIFNVSPQKMDRT